MVSEVEKDSLGIGWANLFPQILLHILRMLYYPNVEAAQIYQQASI